MKNPKYIIIIQNPSMINRGSAALWKLSLVASCASLAFFTDQSHAAQKPSEWDTVVRSAGKSAPTFWLDGNYTPNKGSQLSGEVNYIHGDKVWDQLQTGFWGEPSGAFRTADPVGGSGFVPRLRDSKDSNIGCSENGSLAILFKTASEFHISDVLPPDKHALVLRGENSSPSPFEVAVVNGSLRVATLSDAGKPMFTTLANVNPSTWYWLAMSWVRKNGVTDVQWRVKELANNSTLQSGAFQTSGLGHKESFLMLSLTQSKHSNADTTFSQIIVWDTPLSDEEWAKIEAALK